MTVFSYVDTETVGLVEGLHDVFEVGLVREDDATGEVSEHLWFLRPNLSVADPTALRLNGFYDRTRDVEWTENEEFALEFAQLTANSVWVGMNPTFDFVRLDALVRDAGACIAVHYRLIDMEGAVAAKVGAKPMWAKSDELFAKAGIEQTPAEERHTALGDARMVRRAFHAVWPSPDPQPAPAPPKAKASKKVDKKVMKAAEPAAGSTDESEPVQVGESETETTEVESMTEKPASKIRFSNGMPSEDDEIYCEQCDVKVEWLDALKTWTICQRYLCKNDLEGQRVL